MTKIYELTSLKLLKKNGTITDFKLIFYKIFFVSYY